MQTFALVIAVVSTVAYHLVTKRVPAGVLAATVVPLCLGGLRLVSRD